MKASPSTSYLITFPRAVSSFRLALWQKWLNVSVLTWASLETVGQVLRLCTLSEPMCGVLW